MSGCLNQFQAKPIGLALKGSELAMAALVLEGLDALLDVGLPWQQSHTHNRHTRLAGEIADDVVELPIHLHERLFCFLRAIAFTPKMAKRVREHGGGGLTLLYKVTAYGTPATTPRRYRVGHSLRRGQTHTRD